MECNPLILASSEVENRLIVQRTLCLECETFFKLRTLNVRVIACCLKSRHLQLLHQFTDVRTESLNET